MSHQVRSEGFPGNGNGDTPRTGVFICHCGGNISDVVNVQRVAQEIGALPGVACSMTHTFMCSDPGQALIQEKIKECNLNRVVVAACSPSLHELTFRRTLTRSGLNPYLYEHCNIREQCSWVVRNKELATQKATRLIRAAAARAGHLTPLQKRRIPIHPEALVIGGGIAGLVAARDLAQRGIRVTLVEQSPFLGGRVAQMGKVFPTEERARDLLNPIIAEVVKHPRVTVLTNARVTHAEGIVGNFKAHIQIIPRGVNSRLAAPGHVMAACPVETENEFDFGLTKRKAIYQPYYGCYPQLPAIDWTACTKCGKCIEASGGKGIELDAQPRETEVHAGVIVLATGHDPYEPLPGEYGYGKFPEVVTLQQMYRMLDTDGPTGGEVKANGAPVRTVVFIYCVGARQREGISVPMPDGRVREYCGRTCCTASLKIATELQERYPRMNIYSFYQDVRAYGRGHEEYYTRASEGGAIFLRYDPNHPPRVEKDFRGTSALIVRGRDLLTGDVELEVPADLVVLSTGVVPHDISDLVEIFKCSIGPDTFLLEVHPKLRPVELAVSGVFLAGTCQSPMDITEASAGGAAAASKAAAMVVQAEVEMDPFIATVDEQLCTGCQTCLTVCPYDALSRDEAKHIAVVNEALCTGCGSCAATCPSDAIQQRGFTDRQVLSELLALLARQAPAGAGDLLTVGR